MAGINLRIYNLTVKLVRGVSIHHQSLFSLFPVKSLISFQICYPLKIKFANTKIVEIFSQTKVRVLNINLGSEISNDASLGILKISKTRPLK